MPIFTNARLDDISRVVTTATERAAAALVRLVLDRHRAPPGDIAVVVGHLEAV